MTYDFDKKAEEIIGELESINALTPQPSAAAIEFNNRDKIIDGLLEAFTAGKLEGAREQAEKDAKLADCASRQIRVFPLTNRAFVDLADEIRQSIQENGEKREF